MPQDKPNLDAQQEGTIGNIADFNATASQVLSAIHGLSEVSARIDAAAAAAAGAAAVQATSGAIATITKVRDEAINAIRAAASLSSGNADNPKFQEPHNMGYGPNLQPPE